jgi:hypothetical protein
LGDLYSLLFSDISDTRVENLILAAICIDPGAVSRFVFPGRENAFKKWGSDILTHVSDLGISLESAAAVLGPLVEQDGNVTTAGAAERARRYHKLRIKPPEELADKRLEVVKKT